MSLRNATAIAGVGNTAYTRGTDKSAIELHLEASFKALADAGLTPADVDGIMPAASAGRIVEDFTRNLGIRDLRFSSTKHMGGGSMIASIHDAVMAVGSGEASCVLVSGGRLGYSSERVSTGNFVREHVFDDVFEFEVPYGSPTAATWFAQCAQRHMYLYGTTSEQMGHVSVTMREHAQLNPKALMYGKPITLADHQASRMITTPFRLLDCSLESDGAAAAVIVSAERARDLPKPPVYISGVGESHGYPPTSITQKPDLAFIPALQSAAERAYDMAGITVDDLDGLYIHEGFSWFVIGTLEAIGVCKVGEGGPYVEDGNIKLGGRLPLNTNGGAMSEGHVSGMNHLAEAVRQLRGEVPAARQIANVSTVAVVTEGNFLDGAMTVLSKDAA